MYKHMKGYARRVCVSRARKTLEDDKPKDVNEIVLMQDDGGLFEGAPSPLRSRFRFERHFLSSVLVDALTTTTPARAWPSLCVRTCP